MAEAQLRTADSAIGASPPRLEAGDKATGRARYADDVAPARHAARRAPHQPACACAHPRLPARRRARDPRRQGDRHRRRPERAALGRDHQGRVDGRARQGALRRRAGRRGRGGRRRDRASAPRRRSRSTTSRCRRCSRSTRRSRPTRRMLHEEFAGYVKTRRRRRRPRQRRLRELGHRGRRRARASRECDVVVEGTWETQAQHHVYLETERLRRRRRRRRPDHAARRPASRCITCSSASPRSSASRWRRSARSPRGSAAASAASTRRNIHSIAAWLARAARRPVKLVLSRMQDFEMQRSRHPARIWMQTGARRDGTILARDVRITIDGGAYADESPPVLAFALLMSRGPYRIPNVRASGQAVYTNKLRAGSFRGFGNPQASFAGESQIDDLAARARHRSGRAAPEERDAAGRHRVRRPAGALVRAARMPRRGCATRSAAAPAAAAARRAGSAASASP